MVNINDVYRLTVRLFFPLESYEGSIPEMDIEKQFELAKRNVDVEER